MGAFRCGDPDASPHALAAERLHSIRHIPACCRICMRLRTLTDRYAARLMTASKTNGHARDRTTKIICIMEAPPTSPPAQLLQYYADKQKSTGTDCVSSHAMSHLPPNRPLQNQQQKYAMGHGKRLVNHESRKDIYYRKHMRRWRTTARSGQIVSQRCPRRRADTRTM